MAGVTFVMLGFCKVEANPPGPVQLYVAPAKLVAVRFNVCPGHSGPLFPAATGQGEQEAGAV